MNSRRDNQPFWISTRAGFSLIEMLVVLIILSILLTIALPGYEHVMRKSARSAARVALADVASRQQQYLIYHKRYAINLNELGLPNEYFVDALGDPVAKRAASFEIRLQLDQSDYKGVEALAVNKQSADTDCLRLMLSKIGMRSATTAGKEPSRHCW
ncbi:MAG: type IV pilin protein [Pseudomonadota bacterium]